MDCHNVPFMSVTFPQVSFFPPSHLRSMMNKLKEAVVLPKTRFYLPYLVVILCVWYHKLKLFLSLFIFNTLFTFCSIDIKDLLPSDKNSKCVNLNFSVAQITSLKKHFVFRYRLRIIIDLNTHRPWLNSLNESQQIN